MILPSILVGWGTFLALAALIPKSTSPTPFHDLILALAASICFGLAIGVSH